VDFHHRVNAIASESTIVYWSIFFADEGFRSFPHKKKYGTQVKDLAEVEGNIIILRAHAVEAISVFSELGVKFDYFTAFNEGWVHYPALNNHGFVGFASQILKDEFYYFSEERYYDKCIKRLPYETIQKIESGTSGYIDVYSDDTTSPRALYHLSQKKETSVSKMFNHIQVSLVNKSIWEDYKKLDLIIYSLRTTKLHNDSIWHTVQDNAENVQYIQKRDKEQLMVTLSEADENGYKTIGLTPMGLHGEYQDVINSIAELTFKNIKELHFYHLNEKDYSDIRPMF